MYQVKGELKNTFTKEASEKYPASYKIQIIHDSSLQNGEFQSELITLSVPHDVYNQLIKRLGEEIILPISFGVDKSTNQLIRFYPKNEKL